jgi:hypothetical protein
MPLTHVTRQRLEPDRILAHRADSYIATIT